MNTWDKMSEKERMWIVEMGYTERQVRADKVVNFVLGYFYDIQHSNTCIVWSGTSKLKTLE